MVFMPPGLDVGVDVACCLCVYAVFYLCSKNMSCELVSIIAYSLCPPVSCPVLPHLGFVDHTDVTVSVNVRIMHVSLAKTARPL